MNSAADRVIALGRRFSLVLERTPGSLALLRTIHQEFAMNDKISIPVDVHAVAELAARWGVRELSLFGSVLRDDFTPESDIDVLVEYHPKGGPTFETYPDMLDDFRRVFGREVDVVEKSSIRGSIRRRAILESHRVLYAA
jgi:uncharacterized protein